MQGCSVRVRATGNDFEEGNLILGLGLGCREEGDTQEGLQRQEDSEPQLPFSTENGSPLHRATGML